MCTETIVVDIPQFLDKKFNLVSLIELWKQAHQPLSDFKQITEFHWVLAYLE